MRREGRVERIARCRFIVEPQVWSFADEHSEAIDAHWSRRAGDNPSLFNGVVHLLSGLAIDNGACTGHFLRTEFKSYLYWRDQGFPDTSVRDGFGSALLRSAEGHAILGLQRAGNLNSGQAYMPGGFIDQHDVSADGTIDIAASIMREIGEETGLGPPELVRQPGYMVTHAGALVSIATELRSHLRAHELRARILDHIDSEQEPELADAVIVRCVEDLAGIPMPDYSRTLLTWLFSQNA